MAGLILAYSLKNKKPPTLLGHDPHNTLISYYGVDSRLRPLRREASGNDNKKVGGFFQKRKRGFLFT
ncbi:MAG: hypothetical protein WC687_01855 [Patescibacteria group bacterium]|jgi:hypothetical protein